MLYLAHRYLIHPFWSFVSVRFPFFLFLDLLAYGNDKVLIVSPTREIAKQTCDVITEIGKYLHHISCACFIGGTSVQDDIDQIAHCQIVTGTPGRLKQLLNDGTSTCKMDSTLNSQAT